MKTPRSLPTPALVLLVAAGLSAVAVGCGSPTDGDQRDPSRTITLAPDGPANSDTGAVGFQLSLPSGQLIPVLNWSISGPNGAATVVKSGTITTQSRGVTFLVGNLAVASGYQVSLAGTANDGSIMCAGSASFAITNRQTTPVVVELACSSSTEGAHVTLVNGTTFNCAAWNDVSASPTQTSVGDSVMLSATASGPVASALTYNWSAASGTFANNTAAQTTFTCTKVGMVNVTLVVGDGPVPTGSSCDDSLDTRVIAIQCLAAPDGGASDGGASDGGASDGGASDGGADAGPAPDGGAGGSIPAPALPPWGTSALASVLLALGSLASRRRQGVSRPPRTGASSRSPRVRANGSAIGSGPQRARTG